MEIWTPTQLCGKALFQKGEEKDTLLIGFHGYGETAQIQMQRLENLGTQVSLLCPQALHGFYTKYGDVGYSWMTKDQRERSLAVNLDYIQKTVTPLVAQYGFKHIVCMGFSQGVAMALRFGLCHPQVKSIACLGGDLPLDCQELLQGQCQILWGRGDQDKLMPQEPWEASWKQIQTHMPSQKIQLQGNHFCWDQEAWIQACQKCISPDWT